MAEALTKKDNRNFWKEAKSFQRASKTVPIRIDNADNPQAIINLFHDKFRFIPAFHIITVKWRSLNVKSIIT